MKNLSFVAIFACFLKVSLTWSISNTSEIPPQDLSLQNQVSPVIFSSAADKICYHQYDIRINTVVSKIKNGTDACNRMNDETRFGINEQVKAIQGLTTKCTLELNPKKYIECMKSSAKEIIDQLSVNADKYLKQNKTCPCEVLERGIYGSSSALYDLKLCLQKNHPSTLPITLPKPADDLSEKNVEFLENLNRTTKVYATLKKCVLDGLEFEKCWKQAKNHENLVYTNSLFIIQSEANNYEKIAAIDKAENSCIRQFIIMLDGGMINFDLKGCLIRGYNATMQFEEDEEKDIKLISKLKRMLTALKSCRLITKDLNTEECLPKLSGMSELHQEVRSEISIKSEDYFEKLSEIIEDLYAQQFPCIGPLFTLIQPFSDFRFNRTEKDNYFSCFYKGHKSPLFIPNNNNILDKLKEMKDYIKSCTLHTDSPGFEKCFFNGVMIYRFELRLTNCFVLESKELLEESDKNNNTCFGTLLAEFERLKSTYFEGPKEPRKPEELAQLTELEKCIMNE